jgi:hypothetical protein
MKRIIFFLFIVFISCQKEGNNILTRDEFIGNYCGEIISNNDWSSVNLIIGKSDTVSNQIIIKQLIENDVYAIVDGYNLTIPEQTYRLAEVSSPVQRSNSYFYNFVVSGNGFLDRSNYLLRINLNVSKFYDIENYNKVNQAVIKAYNSSKYSYLGTFSNDSSTVIISSSNDSLLLSIAFSKDCSPCGWDNIKASDNGCHISFQVDSIEDISSGEFYRLRGGALKVGDSLEFSLFAYYHGKSPIYIYDFTVVKEH